MDDTIIVFLSDHGFYFGEHGLWGKGRYRAEGAHYLGPRQDKQPAISLRYRLEDSGEVVNDLMGEWYRGPLYEEITRIPLLIHAPGYERQRLEALVSLPDVMPTILDLVGVEIPERVQAKSLLGLLAGKVDSVHDFVVSSWPMYVPGQRIRVVDDEERNMREHQPSTIRTKDWSMLYSIAGEPVELYDMVTDPEQLHNVVADQRDEAKALHQELLSFLTSLGTAEVFLKLRQRLD
jgi:arylsulfatase A-like enzyme